MRFNKNQIIKTEAFFKYLIFWSYSFLKIEMNHLSLRFSSVCIAFIILLMMCALTGLHYSRVPPSNRGATQCLNVSTLLTCWYFSSMYFCYRTSHFTNRRPCRDKCYKVWQLCLYLPSLYCFFQRVMLVRSSNHLNSRVFK